MPYVNVNSVNLYYEIFVQPDLPKDAGYLLILHGGPGVSDHSLYLDYWSRFANQAKVVFFDMRGHGQSDKDDPKNWNLEQWGKDVYTFCETLNIKPAITVGVSFGGWVALSYALQFPDHAKNLILCNTEACIDNAAQIEVYSKKGGDSAGKIIQKIYKSANPLLWDDYIKFCAPHMSKNPYTPSEIKNVKPNMQLYHHFYQTEQHFFNYLPRLSELKSTILILGGTDDPEHPLKSTLAMKDALINANTQIEIIEGAGDPVYRDSPDEVTNIINTFISEKLTNSLQRSKNTNDMKIQI